MQQGQTTLQPQSFSTEKEQQKFHKTLHCKVFINCLLVVFVFFISINIPTYLSVRQRNPRNIMKVCEGAEEVTTPLKGYHDNGN